MAVTLEDVTVAQGVWVDLYAATSIAVGTAVTVINTGSNACQIAISVAAPATTTVGIPLYAGASGSSAVVAAAQVGLWAYSPEGTSYINVQE